MSHTHMSTHTNTHTHTHMHTPVKKITSQNVCPRIHSLFQTAGSAVSQNCGERGFVFAASAAKFCKRDVSSASESAFLGSFGDIFGCSTPSKKRCFSTQEFTRFVSTV